MKSFVKNLILLILSASLTLAAIWGVGELLLRQATGNETGDNPEMYIKSEDKILKRTLRPGYKGIYYGACVEINSAGFRDCEYDLAKPEGTYRIVLLGDSMCFGQGLSLNATYAKVLESFLNANDAQKKDIAKIEVLNFSVPGYNTIEECELLRTKAIYYKPDLVVLNFFPNDILPLGEAVLRNSLPSNSVTLPQIFTRKLSLIKSKSHFAQYVLSHLAVLGRRMGMRGGYISKFQGEFSEDDRDWLECRLGILKIKKMTEDENRDFIFVIVPFLSDLSEHHPLKEELAAIENFCKVNGISTLNLFPYFYGYRAETLWVNPINGHPNEKAHAIMAEAVGEYIVRKIGGDRDGSL